MQTPLITNFARGIISPKYFGRVESDVYYQGAKTIENFIVNNQGSLERRPGTYRVWNTGFTHPSPVGQEDDRFQVAYHPEKKYTLLLINDQGSTAQFILSSGGEDPQHRFFEITKSQTNVPYNAGMFSLTQFTVDDIEFFPEAHAFAVGSNQMIDDAFVSAISDVTFLRMRHPMGYSDLKSVAWHSTVSRDIARAEGLDNPFVRIAPLDPPEYKQKSSTLDHNMGFRVIDQSGQEVAQTVYRTRKVPQFVGQTIKGQYETDRFRTRMSGTGAIRNVNQNTLIPHKGKLRINIANSDPGNSNYKFYDQLAGDSHISVNGKKVNISPNAESQYVDIDFRELSRVSSNWTEITSVQVQRTWRDRYCAKKSWLIFRGWRCEQRKTRYRHATRTIDIDLAWLALYHNQVYDLDSDMDWTALSIYRLYYKHGPSEVMISELPVGVLSNDHFELEVDIDVITSVRIFSEADINPSPDDVLPAAGAEYILERVLATEEQDVVARRIKPWNRTEGPQDISLELVSSREDWVQYSVDRLEAGRSVLVHNGRMMLIKDEDSPSFLVSTIRDYANFYQNDSEVDSYELSVDTERPERIQWAVSVREGVILGTDRNEYVIVGIESPSSVQSRRFTGIGSSRPYAIRFGDKILFVSRDGKRIMAYSYSDELAAWFSADVSSIAEHLFTSGIQSIHYMEDPISVIWVVPEGNDGIYALTWEPVMGVQAWSHHMKGENVVSATVASIDGDTALFLAVERQGLVTIEAMDFREEGVFGNRHYLDSAEFLFWNFPDEEAEIQDPTGPDGEVLDGETNYTINFATGQWARFQGKDTIIQVNGQTELVLKGDNQPNSSTIVTIGPYEGANVFIEIDPQETAEVGNLVTVAIGYPYVSTLATLPVIMQSPSGVGVMKNTQTQRMRVRVNDSGSFQAGNELEEMTRIELREEGDVVEDLPGSNTYTGDVMIPLTSKWSYRPTMYIQSYYAEPLNVLAIMSDSQVFD